MATTVKTKTDLAYQRCIRPSCGATYDVGAVKTSCDACGSLLDVEYDWDSLPVPKSLAAFEEKWSRRNDQLCLSGVWRFHELLPFAPAEKIVTIGEGQTLLQLATASGDTSALNPGDLYLQYEGMNPSGSFKDNGMSAAFTHAHDHGRRRAACASTGNTSASLALYCSVTKLMQAIIFIGSGKISYGKLSQALDYGALTVQIAGDFDDAMPRVQQVSQQQGIYLVNSVNPFRLEGQKTIMFRVLEGLRWEVPDWIVVPGGNLGNSQRVRQGLSRVARARPDRSHAATGGDQRRRRQHALRTLREARPALERRPARREPDQQLLCRDGRCEAEGLDHRQRHRDQSAGEPDEVPACLGMVRRRGARGDRPGDSRRQGPGRRRRPRLRAGQRGQRRRRKAAARGGGDRAGRARRLHSDRPSTQGPDGHGRLSHDRSERVQRVLGSRGVSRAAFANRAVMVENDLDEIVQAIQLNS